jgi:hypothetical protein
MTASEEQNCRPNLELDCVRYGVFVHPGVGERQDSAGNYNIYRSAFFGCRGWDHSQEGGSIERSSKMAHFRS